MAEPITVIIADDHEVVRLGVRTYLSGQPDIVVLGEAVSGDEAIRLVADVVPDVALVDLIMPEMDGVEATRQIKQISPHTQVIVLTSFHQDEHIFPAIRAGALSYLLKDIAAAEVAEAIRKAARGEAVLHPRIAARVVQEVHGAAHPDFNPFTTLTERELQVLRLIADGLSNAQIAERLVISEKTVKIHVGNVLGKLHLADRTQAAVYAWRTGIVRAP